MTPLHLCLKQRGHGGQSDNRSNFTAGDVASKFGEDGPNEEGERQIVEEMMKTGLLLRLGNAERAVRKPEVVIEQDLIAPEGESEEWLSGT